jgi:hypothetical protein
MKLAYCDKIAHEIKAALDGVVAAGDELIAEVGKINWDLHPTEGYFLSPKKSIIVRDRNGKAYSITIEEQPVLDIEFEDVDKKVVDNEFS